MSNKTRLSLCYSTIYIIPILTLSGFLIRESDYFNFLAILFTTVFLPILEIVFKDQTLDLQLKDKSNKDENIFLTILYLWFPIQFLTIFYIVAYLETHPASLIEHIGLTTSMGIMTAFGINVAHELNHSKNKVNQLLAFLLYISGCALHFGYDHNYLHHCSQISSDDVTTAKKGQSFYNFIFTVFFGVITSTYQHSRKRLRSQKRHWINNVAIRYFVIQTLYFLILFLLLKNSRWLILSQAIFGFMFAMVGAYLAHYGLSNKNENMQGLRKIDYSYSWNTNTLSSPLLLGVDRHSSHHLQGHCYFWNYSDNQDYYPMYPYPYSIMVLLAFIPPLFHRVMDKPLEKVHAQRCYS